MSVDPHRARLISSAAAHRAAPRRDAVAGAIRAQITGGQLTAGMMLPSTRELAAEFDVSVFTVNQAMKLLADEGLIQGHERANRCVAGAPERTLGARPRLLRAERESITAQLEQITAQLAELLDRLDRTAGLAASAPGPPPLAPEPIDWEDFD